MKKERFICIKKLEQNNKNGNVVALPGSYWILEPESLYRNTKVLVNEHREDMVLEVSEYLLELCFKTTARS